MNKPQTDAFMKLLDAHVCSVRDRINTYKARLDRTQGMIEALGHEEGRLLLLIERMEQQVKEDDHLSAADKLAGADGK